MGPPSLTRRTLLLLAAKALAFCFNVALPLVVVRHLSQFEFGIYKQAFLAIASAVSMLPLGFAMSSYYFLPREPSRRPQVAFNILLVGVLTGTLALATCALFPGLLQTLFHEHALGTLAPLIGTVIFFWIPASFLESIAIANGDTLLATRAIVLGHVTRVALLLIATTGWASVRALLWAAVIHGIAMDAVLLWYLASRFPGFWRTLDRGLLRTQIAYALPLGAAGVLYSLQTDLHNYFVAHHFGAAAFAIYSIGCFQLPFVSVLGEAAASVMIARVSELHNLNERAEIIALTARACRKLAALLFPVYALLMVVSREFLVILFTAQYLDSRPILLINLTLIPASVLFVDPIIRVYPEHARFLLELRIALLAALSLTLWIVVPRYGMLAAITATVVVAVVERTLIAAFFARVVGFTRHDARRFRDLGAIVIAAALAALGALLLRRFLQGTSPFWVLVACAVALGGVYLLALLALRVPTPEERRMAWQSLVPFLPPSWTSSVGKMS